MKISPRIIVLCCENDAYPPSICCPSAHEDRSAVRLTELRCLGFGSTWSGCRRLLARYRRNHDARMQVRRQLPVPHGKGKRAANYRLSKAKRHSTSCTRSRKGRVGTDCYRRLRQLPKIITDFVDRIKEIGPNPFKVSRRDRLWLNR